MVARKFIITIGVFFVICVILGFIGVSEVSSETNVVVSRVRFGLSTGLNDFVFEAPRTKVLGNSGFYYVPNGNNESSWAIVYKDLLVNLNQDRSFPLCKVTNVALDSDLSTVLDATATVRFQTFLGFSKTVVVEESIRPLPHFRDMTGARGE